MKKRLAIVLMAAMLAVMSSQAVFADGGKETIPRPEVEVGESAVPEDEPRILTPDRKSLEESPDILTPSGSLGKEPQEVLVEAPGEPDLEALKKQQEENERLQELYDSLSEEERGFIWSEINFKFENESLEMHAKREQSAKRLKNYLEENLFDSQYTFIRINDWNNLEIGVPSLKYKEKIERLQEECGEGVIQFYVVCRYTYKELKSAQEKLENDKELAELMGDRKYTIVNEGDHLNLYCVDGEPLGLNSWLKENDYQDFLTVSRGKPFPE